MQNAIGAHRRATATALIYICLSVIALGLGPLFAGWAIDQFADRLFAGGGFEAACPGGAAAIHAAPAVALACRSTLALATRRGLLITLAFFAWGVVHYFVAAAGFEKSRSTASESTVSATIVRPPDPRW